MTKKEHLIENAIFSMANNKTFDNWISREKEHGNLIDMGEYNMHDLQLIWDCAYYVVYTLYCGPEDFRENNTVRLV